MGGIDTIVSVLFNEPKLLKSHGANHALNGLASFSALQRAEIAEINDAAVERALSRFCFSALQRAEIAEICAGWLANVRS